MIKFIAIVWRKESVSAEEFSRYWREDHAALVRRHAATLGICRYVQNPRSPSETIDELVAARGWLHPPDGIAEVCWTSADAMQAAMATDAAQRANAELAEDEARFCDMTKMTAFLADEIVIYDQNEQG